MKWGEWRGIDNQGIYYINLKIKLFFLEEAFRLGISWDPINQNKVIGMLMRHSVFRLGPNTSLTVTYSYSTLPHVIQFTYLIFYPIEI